VQAAIDAAEGKIAIPGLRIFAGDPVTTTRRKSKR
jgi:hypothetical protein